MRGRLIVIAGTDGSGKRTQTDLLLGRLRDEGFDAGSISFPQYEQSFFGELAGRYLRGEFGPSESVSPYLASVVFALDRWEARDRLMGWLDVGKVVVADRYVCANAGHQAIKISDDDARREFLAWIERMEHDVLGLPRPDLSVLLHVPWRVARDLVGRKPARAYLRGTGRDIHEADDEHLARSERAYAEMAEREPNWRSVECCRKGRLLAPREIAEAVWAEVEAELGAS